MSGARESILAALRAGRTASPTHGRPSPPERMRAGHPDAVARFVDRATAVGTEVQRMASAASVPTAVADELRRYGLPPAITVAPDPAIRGLGWAEAGLAARSGPAEPSDAVSVTPAVAGIAETGTLLVKSGAATPNTLHLLPDIHIAVLRVPDIVDDYEAGLARLQSGDNAGLPRAATLITGPSRSSDIERVVQIGVHGPRRLLIYLIDGEEDG